MSILIHGKGFKLSILGVSSLLSVVMFILPMYGLDIILWSSGNQVGDYVRISDLIIHALPVFLFSLLVAPLSMRVFKYWLLLTLVWLPVSLVVIVTSSAAGTFLGPTERAFNILCSFVIYGAISLIVIITQSIRVYWLKK